MQFLERFDKINISYVLISNIILLIIYKLISFFENNEYGVWTLISLGLFLICCCISLYKIIKFIEGIVYKSQNSPLDNNDNINIEKKNKLNSL